MRFLTSLKYLILMAKILGVGLVNLGGWFGHCEFFSHEIVKFYRSEENVLYASLSLSSIVMPWPGGLFILLFYWLDEQISLGKGYQKYKGKKNSKVLAKHKALIKLRNNPPNYLG